MKPIITSKARYCIAKWTPKKKWHIPKDLEEYFDLRDAEILLKDAINGDVSMMGHQTHAKSSKNTKYKIVQLVHIDV